MTRPTTFALALPSRRLGGFIVTDTGRAFSATIASLSAQVSPVLSTIQGGSTTPQSNDLSTAISVLSQIGTQIQQLAAFDTAGVYKTQTDAMAADLPVVQKLFYDEQNNIAHADPNSGFVGPVDPAELSKAAAAWTDLLSQAGGVAGAANALDANLAGGGGGGAGPSAPSGVTPNSTPAPSGTVTPTPTSPPTPSPPSPGPTTLPPAPAGTPVPPAPPTQTTHPSALPAVTPAAAIAIGFGGILVLGVIVSALRGGGAASSSAPAKNPRRRRHGHRRRSR